MVWQWNFLQWNTYFSSSVPDYIFGASDIIFFLTLWCPAGNSFYSFYINLSQCSKDLPVYYTPVSANLQIVMFIWIDYFLSFLIDMIMCGGQQHWTSIESEFKNRKQNHVIELWVFFLLNHIELHNSHVPHTCIDNKSKGINNFGIVNKNALIWIFIEKMRQFTSIFLQKLKKI